MIKTAVILTHNRPELLERCVDAIGPQVDALFIVDNASNPPAALDDLRERPSVADALFAGRWVPDQPPNIPRMWKLGIDWSEITAGWDDDGHRPHAHTAFLCDDAIVPAGWFDAVSEAMQRTGAAAGCSDPFGRLGGEDRLKTEQDGDISGRMIGWAFILDLAAGIVPDESMPWWWCDTDIDWQARAAGGFVMTGGPELIVPNERPGEFTGTVPGLMQQSGDDGVTFAAKWGGRPW